MVASNLLSTGAFEVFFNNELIYSKIATGEVPDINWLIQTLNNGQFGQSLPQNAY